MLHLDQQQLRQMHLVLLDLGQFLHLQQVLQSQLQELLILLLIIKNSSTVTMAVNNAYLVNNGATLVTLTLPTTATLGDKFQVVGTSSGGWTIAQNSGQTINFGNVNTTTGTGGSLSSTNRYDQISLMCNVANTGFVVTSSVGNITYV
jgi:hypothetical protein